MLQNLLFGDNQFFGVNHMSEEKSQQQLMRFNSVQKMVDTLKVAYEAGVKGFMLHAHALADEFCSLLRAEPEYWKDLVIYPALPHPVKYINAVSEKGAYKTLLDTLKEGSDMRQTVLSLAQGGLGVLSNDPRRLARSLIDIEMRPYKGLKIGAVFLHNIAVDLLLGLGINEFYPAARDHVQEKYGAELGFISVNLPLAVDSLEAVGIEKPIVMASVNKIGYYMNPTQEACEACVRSGRARVVAMSILASGAVPPREAVEYVSSLPVASVVYGASTPQHIVQTKQLLDELYAPPAAASGAGSQGS